MRKDEREMEDWVAAQAWALFGVPSIHLTVHGDTGWPDRVFILPAGRTLWHEYKQPGEPMDPRQVLKRDILEYRQHAHRCFDNREEALADVKAAYDAARAEEVDAPQLPTKGAQVPARTRRRRAVP
jgi:hypothetical protein